MLADDRSNSAAASPGDLGQSGASESLVRIFLLVVETNDLLTVSAFVSKVGVPIDVL